MNVREHYLGSPSRSSRRVRFTVCRSSTSDGTTKPPHTVCGGFVLTFLVELFLGGRHLGLDQRNHVASPVVHIPFALLAVQAEGDLDAVAVLLVVGPLRGKQCAIQVCRDAHLR